MQRHSTNGVWGVLGLLCALDTALFLIRQLFSLPYLFPVSTPPLPFGTFRPVGMLALLSRLFPTALDASFEIGTEGVI